MGTACCKTGGEAGQAGASCPTLGVISCSRTSGARSSVVVFAGGAAGGGAASAGETLAGVVTSGAVCPWAILARVIADELEETQQE